MRYDEAVHQINCRVDGARPAAQIKWINASGAELPATTRTFTQGHCLLEGTCVFTRMFLLGRLYSTVSTLALVPSLSLHRSRFTCDVRHETLTDPNQPLRTSFDVEVTSPPSQPIIRGYPSSFRLINGSRLTLSCQSQGGHPLGRLSWYRFESGNEVSNLIDNSFVVLNQNNATENNISMVIAPSDNNVTLACHAINGYLYSLGQRLQTNITLQVACEKENGLSRSSSLMFLLLVGPASIQIRGNAPNQNMSVTTVVEGTTRQFVCRTTSSYPRAIVTWKLDGHLITGDVDPLEERAEYAGTTMQLVKTIGLDKSLRDYHRKILSCEARNPETGQVVTDTTRLNIICTFFSLSPLPIDHLLLFPVDATSIEMHGITKEKIIKAGDTIIAECTLTGGNPLGKITWYKGETNCSVALMRSWCSLGGELLRSEYISETSGNYALSRVEFVASPSDNQLPLICKGQVESFPERTASFTLNVACKWLKNAVRADLDCPSSSPRWDENHRQYPSL